MSLRKRQLSRALNTVIERALKSGFYPGFETVTYRLSKELAGRSLGAPSMRLRLVPAHGKSSSKDYNDTMHEIYQDLEDLYAELGEQSKQILTNFRYQDIEREKLRHKITRIESKLDKLLLLAKDSSGYLDCFGDTFTDLSKVDMRLEGVPPVPVTSAYVDTRLGEVRLKEARDVDRLDLSAARVVLEGISSYQELSPIQCAVDENLNTAWLIRVPYQGAPVSAAVTIEFPSEFELNTVVVRQHSPKPTQIAVEVQTRDGWSRIEEEAPVHFEKAFKTKNILASALRLILTKQEADETLASESSCYFGLRDVAVLNVSYVESGVLVSRPYSTDRISINQVSLETDEDAPPGTSIEYFVAFPKEGGSYAWVPISRIDDPNPRFEKVIDLHNVQGLSFVSSPGSPGYGTVYGTVNGVPFYRIATLPYPPRPGSVSVRQGAGQLVRISFVNQDVYNTEGDSHVPLPQDYTNELPKDSGVFDLSRNLPFDQGIPQNAGGGFYKFKLYVRSKEYRDIPLKISASGGNISVYLNGRHESNTLRFVPGMNTLEIFMYKHKDAAPGIDLGSELFGFLSSCEVYALRDPMIFVDDHTLFYEIAPNNRGFFTVAGSDIITNFFPSPLRFSISYQASLGEQRTLVFMARLSRDKGSPGLTPRLKSYRLKLT